MNGPQLSDIHSKVITRLYHEDTLLGQRTYNFLTFNAVLGALALLGRTPNGEYTFLSYTVAGLGMLLSFLHAAFGRRVRTSISFWREYLKLIEQSATEAGVPIPVDSLLFEYYTTRRAQTPWGKIEADPIHPNKNAMYDTFPWTGVQSTNTLIGVWLPCLLATYWSATIGFGLYKGGHWCWLAAVVILSLVGAIVHWQTEPAPPKALLDDKNG